MRLPQALRMLWRETRSSPARILFFAACLALGVAAVVTVVPTRNSITWAVFS